MFIIFLALQSLTELKNTFSDPEQKVHTIKIIENKTNFNLAINYIPADKL